MGVQSDKDWFIGYCRIARIAILFVLLGLVVIVGWFYFLGPVVLRAGSSLQALLHYLLGALVIWHPTILFMLALWFLQRAATNLVQQAATNLVQQAATELRLARNLAWAGWLLMAGALSLVTSRPLLLHSDFFARLLLEQNLQYPIWTAKLFDHYVAGAVIGLVGALLVLLSKVVWRQARAAEELRQIF